MEKNSWELAGFMDNIKNPKELTLLLDYALDIIASDDNDPTLVMDTTLIKVVERLYRRDILPDVYHIHIKLKEYKLRYNVITFETYMNTELEKFFREYLEGEFLTRN